MRRRSLVHVLGHELVRRQLPFASTSRHGLRLEQRGAAARPRREQPGPRIDELHVHLGGRQRSDVSREASKRDLGGQDALAATQLGIESHRQHDVGQVQRPTEEHRADSLARPKAPPRAAP